MISVAHVITGLEVGGAEMVLFNLLEHMDDREFDSRVFSLSRGGPLAGRMQEVGISVTELGFPKNRSWMRAAYELVDRLKELQPNVVQTWMYHADLLGGLAARRAGVSSVAWGLHAGPLPRAMTSRPKMVARRGLGYLSHRVPDLVIACSQSSRIAHEAHGYDPERMRVIFNGFHIPPRSAEERKRTRDDLDLAPNSLAIGRVGRYHPQKDYRTLLEAFSFLSDQREDLTLCLVGQGLDHRNEELLQMIRGCGLGDSVRLLGPREDVQALYQAFDIVVSSSNTEAFPMVVGEAMAMGTPVVVTDVGDSAFMVGDARRVVPPGAARKLADALAVLCEDSEDVRAAIGARDRDRIDRMFNVETMARQYAITYRELAAKDPV